MAPKTLSPFPYFAQTDSRRVDQRMRMCFSSSMAMACAWCFRGAENLNPFRVPTGTIAAAASAYAWEQPDDMWLRVVSKSGDTTDPLRQQEVMRSTGVWCTFRHGGSLQNILDLIDEGVGVPVGWIHQGHWTDPKGGGHWSVVVGYDKERKMLQINDPAGEPEMIGGGFVTMSAGSGKGVWVTFERFLARWMIQGPGSGWYMDLSGSLDAVGKMNRALAVRDARN